MRRHRSVAIAVLAVLAACAGITASASAALPTLLFLPGESAEVEAEGEISGPPKLVGLETELGEEVSATGVKFKLGPFKNGHEAGKYGVELKGVTFAGKKCNNVGAAKETGIVRDEDEIHIVFVVVTPTAVYVFLILIVILEAECGAIKLPLEGAAIAKVSKNAAKDVTLLGMTFGCTKPGKAELATYLNGKGESVKALLKTNIGLGRETVCLRSPEVTLLFSHMVTIEL